MFRVAVYGTGQVGTIMRCVIEDGYTKVAQKHGGEGMEVAAFVADQGEQAPVVDGIAVLDLPRFHALYAKGLLQGLVLPRESFFGMSNPLRSLLQLGVDIQDIYVANRVTSSEFREQELLSFFVPYLGAKHLPYLEFHVADHCNLGCKACTHYSGLVSTPHVPNLSQFAKDMEQLHSFVDDIGMIRILGGEPLLNPEINEYMALSRKWYPYAVICVVTNGLRLLDMPEKFFRAMQDYRVHIHLSCYPPAKHRVPQIEERLGMYGITCIAAPLTQKFEMTQALESSGDTGYFYRCSQAGCHNLYEGKIAACPLPFMTKYFNAYFKKDLPEDGMIDLYDAAMTTEELKARLLKPFGRCSYCHPPVMVDWQQIQRPSVLSDWVTGEETS